MPRASAPTATVDVQLVEPSVAADQHAEHQIRSAARYSPTPVLHARVRVIRHRDPAVARPFVAKATLDLPGHRVRAEATAPTQTEALDRLHDRLVAQLTHHQQRTSGSWEARRGRTATGQEHEWRHGDEPTARPPYFDRPPEEREIIPHTSVSPAPCTVDDAAADLTAMDYRFHLFTEIDSGQDSVLYRGSTSYRLAQVEPRPDQLAPHRTEITVVTQPAPMLSVPEAVEQLILRGGEFLFFLDADQARGALIYHRYDGHYGLVSPAH